MGTRDEINATGRRDDQKVETEKSPQDSEREDKQNAGTEQPSEVIRSRMKEKDEETKEIDKAGVEAPADDPPLTLREKEAIRKYMITLVTLPGIVITVLAFILGYFVKGLSLCVRGHKML